MLIAQSTPSQRQNFSWAHSYEYCHFRDKPFPEIEDRKAQSDVFDRHNLGFSSLGCLWCKKQTRRVLWNHTFLHREIEDLFQVPPEVIDDAERKARCRFLVEKILEFLPASGEFRQRPASEF